MSGKARSENPSLVILATSMELGKLTRFSRKSDSRFSPCDNSAKIPLESHEIPEGGSRSFSIWGVIFESYEYGKR